MHLKFSPLPVHAFLIDPVLVLLIRSGLDCRLKQLHRFFIQHLHRVCFNFKAKSIAVIVHPFENILDGCCGIIFCSIYLSVIPIFDATSGMVMEAFCKISSIIFPDVFSFAPEWARSSDSAFGCAGSSLKKRRPSFLDKDDSVDPIPSSICRPRASIESFCASSAMLHYLEIVAPADFPHQRCEFLVCGKSWVKIGSDQGRSSSNKT